MPLRATTGFQESSPGPSPPGIFWTGATPQGEGTPVHISLPRIADPGGKKGGSLPSTSTFPERHRRAAR